MSKILSKFKVVLIVLLSLAVIPVFTGASCDKTVEPAIKTPLSEEEEELLKYYQEPTLEMNFDDNRVCIILKSAFKDLEEISFDYFKILENVSHILYADLYTKKFDYVKGGKFPLDKCKTRHMFELVFEEHSKEKVIEICNLLKTLDMIWVSEPHYIYKAIDNWVPNDKDYYDQWGLHGTHGINIEQAWDITRGSLDVKVGIMEDNIDMTHYDLEGRVFYGNFTPSSDANKRHGTPIAGVIGAIQNNEAGEEGIAGIAGIAECSMYLLNRNDFAGSLRYAEQNNIKIVNASFEFRIDEQSGPEYYQPYNLNQYQAIQDYSGLLVTSAGNDGNNNDNIHHYPSDYDLPNVISVGALSKSGTNMAYSNYGKTSVDLFAPGSDIYSTMPPNNSFGYKHGTSIAAPHVTGVAALIYAKYPFLSASEVKNAILNNVDKLDNLEDLCVTGGKLNAYKALSNAHKHNYTCKYVNSKQHQMMCEICSECYLEDHTFTFLPSKSNSMDVNMVKVRKICTGCGYVTYGDIGYVPITKDEEEQFAY